MTVASQLDFQLGDPRGIAASSSDAPVVGMPAALEEHERGPRRTLGEILLDQLSEGQLARDTLGSACPSSSSSSASLAGDAAGMATDT